MKCPKCGANDSIKGIKCTNCNFVFARFIPKSERASTTSTTPSISFPTANATNAPQKYCTCGKISLDEVMFISGGVVAICISILTFILSIYEGNTLSEIFINTIKMVFYSFLGGMMAGGLVVGFILNAFGVLCSCNIQKDTDSEDSFKEEFGSFITDSPINDDKYTTSSYEKDYDYSSYSKNSYEYRVCPRCGGKGYLSQYSHVQDGVCFRCGGSGEI